MLLWKAYRDVSMRIILLGIDHDLQWKDHGGHLCQILVDLINDRAVELLAEESTGLPTTVAQRLAGKLEKPWIEIDMSEAEKKLAGIDEALANRETFQVPPLGSGIFGVEYLPHEDAIREEEWLRRILQQGGEVVLCLCGYLHLDPFTKRLEEAGCHVEKLALTELSWFQALYGKYSIVEKNGERWCEVQRPQPI
jgi:hypothetical protein